MKVKKSSQLSLQTSLSIQDKTNQFPKICCRKVLLRDINNQVRKSLQVKHLKSFLSSLIILIIMLQQVCQAINLVCLRNCQEWKGNLGNIKVNQRIIKKTIRIIYQVLKFIISHHPLIYLQILKYSSKHLAISHIVLGKAQIILLSDKMNSKHIIKTSSLLYINLSYILHLLRNHHFNRNNKIKLFQEI